MIVDLEARTITFHQSWLNNYFNCPEQSRRYLLEPEQDQSGDAAILGTGVHAYAELRLMGEDRATALAAGFNALDHEFSLPHRNQKMSDGQVFNFLPTMCASFEKGIMPNVERGGQSEVGFSQVVGTWNGWTIILEGKIDYITPRGKVWDWKTSGQPYKKWEKERWAVQPTAYCYAAVMLGLAEYPVPWAYGIVLKSPMNDPAVQIVEFERQERDIFWLRDQILSIVNTHVDFSTGAKLTLPWPKRDQHALCSEKWCPFWTTCKGKYL